MSEQNMNGWINENENIPVEKTDEVRETAAEAAAEVKASAAETASEAAETVSDVSGNPGPAVQQSGYQSQMNQAAGAQQNFTGATQHSATGAQHSYTGAASQTYAGASQQSAAGAQQYHTGAAQQNFTGASQQNFTGASQQNYTGAAQQGSAGAQQSAGFEQQRSGYGTQQQSAFHASQNEHRKADTGYNPVKEKKKKPMTTGKKWVLTVCMALVFGLVAGVVMFGVNSIGNRMVGTDRISAEAEKAEPKAGAANDNQKAEPEMEAAIPEAQTGPAEPDANVSMSTSESLGSVEAVVEKCMPSVVTIATISVQEMQNIFGGTQSYEAQGAGTGVIVGQNDTELLIATNQHVVENANSLSVGFIDESSYEAQVKGSDAANDLAIVSVKLEDISDETMSKISVVELGDSDALNLGEQVVVIGNSLGVGQTVTSGCVSAFGRELQVADANGVFISSDLIQTDASINAGNSGGALLNMKGELVGINEGKTAYSSGGVTVDNVGYAIPISKAKPILEEMMTFTTRDKAEEGQEGYIGVTCKDITSDSDLVTVYGFPEGVCFLEVFEGGPCANAGFMKGDVLQKFDGRSISSYEELKDVLQYYSAGEEVEVTVLRQSDMNGDYEEITANVTLCDYDTLEGLASVEQ